MFPQPLPSQGFAFPQWPAPSIGCRPGFVDRVDGEARERWVAAFVERLVELRPQDDEDFFLALAAEIWPEVGGHDPMIAAEMEHEVGFDTD